MIEWRRAVEGQQRAELRVAVGADRGLQADRDALGGAELLHLVRVHAHALGDLLQGRIPPQLAGELALRRADLRELGLEVSTVRSHAHSVYRKLGVVDRAQAVLIASGRGWL